MRFATGEPLPYCFSAFSRAGGEFGVERPCLGGQILRAFGGRAIQTSTAPRVPRTGCRSQSR